MAGYGDDSGFTAFLTANGYTLPVGAPTPAVLRQRGSAYIDGLHGLRFSGVPTGGFAQERAWPRTGAEAYGVAIDPAVVPVAVIQASYTAAYQEAVKPGSLSVVVSGGKQVKRVKAGSVEVEYASADGGVVANSTPLLSAVEGLLAPFLTVSEPAVFVV